MACRIKILPEDLINKIAAGEVIERPASVVKELLENAIDAGASRITAEIQGAGRKLIRVSDNGQGMTEEEIRLALERHSTSKISRLDDLFNITSLGFRGEALPSIASVAKLEIRTKTQSSAAGSLLKSEGGKNPALESLGAPRGTSVTVKDLFFNTPARKKFLKAPATEMGHIGDIVSKYTLAYPQISFELIADGKPLLHSPGSGRLKDAVAAVYGHELAQGLAEVKADFQSGKISGLVSRPNISRLDRNYENFFVNGRYVRNFLLNRALEEAYRTLIPGNRYPAAIIFIEIDPKQVDVNVHPTKREIKFVKTQVVMDAVTTAVRGELSNFNEVRSEVKGGEAVLEAGSEKWGNNFENQLPISRIQTGILPQNPAANIQDLEFVVSEVQPLLPIYQFKHTYIICTDGEELVLIDQHAAHERIIYDQLASQSAKPAEQALLIPENIELSPKENIVLQQNLSLLHSLGFALEEFGNNSWLMRAVPALALKSAAKQLLKDIIAEIDNLGKSAQLAVKQENIKKLVACHSAVKAGDKLTQAEINQLIRDLYKTKNPLTCPHGRPTLIRLTEAELKKRFLR